MAEEPQGLGAAGTSFVSVLVAVIALAFFGQRFLLQDTRPVVQAANSGSGGLQTVDARLWEDPFFATQRFLEAKSGLKGEATLCSKGKVPFQSSIPPLLILLPGGPYEQATETRRRIRYAVLTALHADGIEPVDPEHLGCLRQTDAQSDGGKPSEDQGAGNKLPERQAEGGKQTKDNGHPGKEPKVPDDGEDDRPFWAVPYERFISASSKPSYFPVVWVDENRLKDLPDVLGALKTLSERFSTDNKTKTLRVIGPYSSMLLKQMEHPTCEPEWTVKLYNYGATMEPSPPILAAGEKSALPAACLKILQVVNTDDRLAHLLSGELARRMGKAHRIALVSEIDTTYGQELSRSVAAALDTNNPAATSHRVVTVGYLRGLDGSLPRLSSDASDSAVPASAPPSGNGRAEQASATSARSYEQAEGNGQLDYLERLPGPLRELERTGPDGGGEIGAIGLLGSDVYDKILILRALRPRFPKAVFFTTDLDARLFDPRDFAATRGLIVASSFGLRLAPIWQAGTPSFRDSYQTSAFLAVRLATWAGNHEGQTAVEEEKLSIWHETPELYEIGRWGPAALSTGLAPNSADVIGYPGPGFGLAAIQLPVNERARASAMTPSQVVGYWGLTIAFWLVLALEFRLFRYRLLAWTSLGVTLLALVLLGVVPEGSAARGLLTGGGLGEPLSLTNGISLWPVVGVRIVGSFFCVYSIFSVIRKLDGNAETLEKEFDLLERSDGNSSGAGVQSGSNSKPGEGTGRMDSARQDTLRARLLTAMRTFVAGVGTSRSRAMSPKPSKALPQLTDAGPVEADGPSIYDADSSDYLDVQTLWKRLSPRDALPRHLRATIYTAACFVLFVFLCLASNNPHVPARGWTVWWAYWLVTVSNVLLMQYLVMLVFDATTFSSYFVRKVRDIDSKWPSSATGRYADKFGLLNGAILSEWIDIRLIATRTACIIELVYFPFIALSIFALSLSAVFDDVPLYPPVLALVAGGFGLLFYIAFRLRSEAEKVRSQALDRVRAQMLLAGSRHGDPEYLETCLETIKAESGGAFKPLSRQPALRAVALPLSSFGGSALLQQFLVP